jgi:hypothetical protein
VLFVARAVSMPKFSAVFRTFTRFESQQVGEFSAIWLRLSQWRDSRIVDHYFAAVPVVGCALSVAPHVHTGWVFHAKP